MPPIEDGERGERAGVPGDLREGAVLVYTEQVDAVESGDEYVRGGSSEECVDVCSVDGWRDDGRWAGGRFRLRRRREGAVLVHADQLDGVVVERAYHRVRVVPDGDGVDATVA